MITLQHAALFSLALAEKRRITSESTTSDFFAFKKELHNEIPWLLLPDAIRAYIKPRQASHFELVPSSSPMDENMASWMEYPNEETLKTLSQENATQQIDFFVADSYPECVIGEETQLDWFDTCNWKHKHRIALRCHFIQDILMDACLRNAMVDVEHRFIDFFTIYHSKKIIDGQTLRNQVRLFEKLGFINLVGAIYEKTGMLLNREWFNSHVYEALKEAYPIDLAEKTYSYMSIDDALNERINNHDFALTDEEIESVIITDNLEDVLDSLYAHALQETYAML